jgi:hypothetical protein
MFERDEAEGHPCAGARIAQPGAQHHALAEART